MRTAVALVAGALTLCVAMPAAAQFKPTNLFGKAIPTPKPPSVDWNWRPLAEGARAARPSVVCGMTLIPADPKIDPRMRVSPPAGGATFTMRAVQPTICRTP